MLIESLEKKTKLAMFTVLLAVSASAVTCGLCFYFAISLVRGSQCQRRDLRPVLLLCHQSGQGPAAAGVCVGREHSVYGRA